MQMKINLLITGVLLYLISFQVSAQDTIRHFQELENRVLSNSLTLKSGELKLTQAKKERLAAIFGLIDPTGSVTGSYTNNTKLPVNLIPAEILGGQPGTFQEVRFGVQYVTNLNSYVEVKLINLQAWESFQLSRINVKVSESDKKVALKNLLENCAIVYYNIINLQEQLIAFQQNFCAADTLYRFTLDKFSNGLASTQDLNDSKVNKLNIEESINQLQYQIKQQYIALKILCDIPDDNKLLIGANVGSTEFSRSVTVDVNPLVADNATERARLARSAFRASKYSVAPALSLFASYQSQQYSTRANFFDNGVDWSTSNYIGIKLSIPLPNSQTFKQVGKAKYDYLMAKNYAEQMNLQVLLNSKQLLIDYNKAESQLNSNLEIFKLRRENYQRNLLNYKEGVAGLEQTVNSFNSMISSQYSYISSVVNLLLVKEKIDINNKLK